MNLVRKPHSWRFGEENVWRLHFIAQKFQTDTFATLQRHTYPSSTLAQKNFNLILTYIAVHFNGQFNITIYERILWYLLKYWNIKTAHKVTREEIELIVSVSFMWIDLYYRARVERQKLEYVLNVNAAQKQSARCLLADE